MNKHKIAWIALAAGIVFVIMLTWLVGVSPQISHIQSSDAQTAQIDENNKETREIHQFVGCVRCGEPASPSNR